MADVDHDDAARGKAVPDELEELTGGQAPPLAGAAKTLLLTSMYFRWSKTLKSAPVKGDGPDPLGAVREGHLVIGVGIR